MDLKTKKVIAKELLTLVAFYVLTPIPIIVNNLLIGSTWYRNINSYFEYFLRNGELNSSFVIFLQLYVAYQVLRVLLWGIRTLRTKEDSAISSENESRDMTVTLFIVNVSILILLIGGVLFAQEVTPKSKNNNFEILRNIK